MALPPRIIVPTDVYEQLASIHGDTRELLAAAMLMSTFLQSPEGQDGLKTTCASIDAVLEKIREKQSELADLLMAVFDENVESHGA